MISKYILIITYNREDKTKEVLDHLKKSANLEKYELVVVRQEGNDKVKSLIDSIDWINVHHLTTFKKSTVKQSINYNVHKGVQFCFEILKAKHVVVIEDDILIGYDFLPFCEDIIEKYYLNDKFRAINGFSAEKFKVSELASYGRFRFGVGWGWCLTDRVWRKLRLIWKGEENAHFDAIIEPFMKAGFVVMPMCSRTLNIGWGNQSSHSPQSEEDEVYMKLKNSWVGSNPMPVIKYVEQIEIKYTWRNDCKPYSEKTIFNKIYNSLFFFIQNKLIILRLLIHKL